MDINLLIKEISKLSEQIQSKEPPAFTLNEKQAAITMANTDKAVTDLIKDGMSPKIIVMSLFYFWLHLETTMLNISEERFDNWQIDFAEGFRMIVNKIKAIVNTLPNQKKELERAALENKLDLIKSFISAERLDQNLPHNKLVFQTEKVNKKIHECASELLIQNFHPMIISNVLFGRWIRLSALQDGVPESFYQKIEYYFTDVINEVRKYLPSLF